MGELSHNLSGNNIILFIDTELKVKHLKANFLSRFN